MGRLFDYYRVCAGNILASRLAAYGFEPNGAPGMGNSLVELCSHIRHGGLGGTGVIAAGGTFFSIKQYGTAGSGPYGSRRYENEKLAWNGSGGDGLDYGLTLLFIKK